MSKNKKITPSPNTDDSQSSRGYSGNLRYNEEEDSFEYDIEKEDPRYPNEDPEYLHDDPYDTAAPHGEDDNSDWDEANPYVGDEYDPDRSLESDAEDLGMHIDKGQITRLSKKDRDLSQTPEDFRDDLDEEGYPKRDT